MKKLLSLALILCLVLALAACGKGDATSQESDAGSAAEVFVKPAQYASVLLVTINPQFRLYLDENEQVLAVEAVNQDAQSIQEHVSLENANVEAVVESIVTAAHDAGFVKAEATIHIEMSESRQTNPDTSALLSRVEKQAQDTAEKLHVEIQVQIDKDDVSDPTNPTDTTGAVTTTKPAHVHRYSPATCTEPKKCSCGAVEGTALGHDFKDGVCTRCQAKDPGFKPTSILKKQGIWQLKYLHDNELYSVKISVWKPGIESVSVAIGGLLSSMPPEMQNDPATKNDCTDFNGQTYYLGRGDGDSVTVKENGTTVTLTDSRGNTLVLTRTGENMLKCTASPASFAFMANNIPVGSVFTFVAG